MNRIADHALAPTRRVGIGSNDGDFRLILAIGFSFLFAVTILAAVGLTLWPGRDVKTTWEIVKDMLGVLLPAETGLLGSILGFYFGAKSFSDAQRLEERRRSESFAETAR